MMIEDSSVVQAGYIAKIIDFQGAFYIEHKGKNIVSTAINAGDIVTLKKGTKITFNIDEKTQGTIVGPAQFEIQEEKNTSLNQSIYKLNILRGDFVQIASINDTTEQNIDISIQDITVRQRIGQTASRYTITKKGSQHIVNNQGASLLVATADNQKTISSKQILAIANNDITLIEDEKIIASAINKGDISQTITIGDDKPAAEDIELAALLTEVNSNTEIDTNTLSMVAMTKISDQDGKVVPTPEQNTQIQNALNGKFLTNNMQAIFINPGDTKAMQQVTDKLSSVAKTLDMKIQVRGSLESIASSATELANQLESRYFVSPNNIANLRAIAAWGTYIKKQGTFVDTDAANKALEELTNNMPSNLRFQ
ncbi:hypothetical protein KBA84_01760 [Patescibacteria group bacterium]|nr:hypothetical protein [Patescibacteria group bacterium]